MNEMCSKVRAAAKDYWTTAAEKRTILYRWIEEHISNCQNCADAMQDIAEALLESRRKS